MQDITIGILGGMGARSTAPYLDLVIDQCQALYGASQNDEYPHIITYSIPAPLYLDRPLDHEKVPDVVSAGLQRLENCGVDFIAMPCNTAHIFYDQLQASINVPLLHIVDETINILPDNINSISLLAAPFTVEEKVYDAGFASAGLRFEHTDAWQQAVNNLLAGIKAGGKLDTLKAQWSSLLNQVRDAGVDAAVIGCTDLNAVTRYVEPPLPVVDATEALARATVQRYLDLAKVPA
jgi:aspartate racemase